MALAALSAVERIRKREEDKRIKCNKRKQESIRRGFAPSFVNYKKGALDSQLQVIKFTCCLPRIGGSLRLPPPLKLFAKI
jgi:hypothetical protein